MPERERICERKKAREGKANTHCERNKGRERKATNKIK